MLSFNQKIFFLEKQLNIINDNYADSFKADIYIFFGDFNDLNPNLFFIKKLNSKIEIINWINNLTSRIVLKFDSEFEQINDFIYDYLENG